MKKHKNIKFLQLLFSLSLVLAFSTDLFAQDSLVKGVVKDSKSGEPLIGACVQVKGTNIGTTSGIDGSFTLPVEKGQTLIVSSLGYTLQEVKVDGTTLYRATARHKSLERSGCSGIRNTIAESGIECRYFGKPTGIERYSGSIA